MDVRLTSSLVALKVYLRSATGTAVRVSTLQSAKMVTFMYVIFSFVSAESKNSFVRSM